MLNYIIMDLLKFNHEIIYMLNLKIKEATYQRMKSYIYQQASK
jgi:hypothetical protein